MFLMGYLLHTKLIGRNFRKMIKEIIIKFYRTSKIARKFTTGNTYLNTRVVKI